mmetsp:Transcript_10047/g.39106  ORF Transcript_10047/g.39106 Transcript_10047/m.39106 type:complete len:316 (-) Transcript_10047:885-1832(-)
MTPRATRSRLTAGPFGGLERVAALRRSGACQVCERGGTGAGAAKQCRHPCPRGMQRRGAERPPRWSCFSGRQGAAPAGAQERALPLALPLALPGPMAAWTRRLRCWCRLPSRSTDRARFRTCGQSGASVWLRRRRRRRARRRLLRGPKRRPSARRCSGCWLKRGRRRRWRRRRGRCAWSRSAAARGRCGCRRPSGGQRSAARGSRTSHLAPVAPGSVATRSLAPAAADEGPKRALALALSRREPACRSRASRARLGGRGAVSLGARRLQRWPSSRWLWPRSGVSTSAGPAQTRRSAKRMGDLQARQWPSMACPAM